MERSTMYYRGGGCNIMLVNKSHYCMAAGAIVRKPRALHAGLA